MPDETIITKDGQILMLKALTEAQAQENIELRKEIDELNIKVEKFLEHIVECCRTECLIPRPCPTKAVGCDICVKMYFDGEKDGDKL